MVHFEVNLVLVQPKVKADDWIIIIIIIIIIMDESIGIDQEKILVILGIR